MADPAPRLPDDPRLATLVRRARSELAEIDPLGAVLLGDEPGGLPDAGIEAHEDDRGRLQALLDDLEAVTAGGEDEVDRLSLVFGLRRAVPPEGPRPPVGAVLLERHLLARLSGLAVAPVAAAEAVARALEAAPAFLAGSREGSLGAPAGAGDVALAAAKRLPQLFDVIARAAGTIDIVQAMRLRLEAALGPALAASAEDSGWILKEYQPEALDYAAPTDPDWDGTHLGLGASLDELEAAAEQLLADQAAMAYAGLDADGSGAESGAAGSERMWGPADVAEALRRAEEEVGGWCPAPSAIAYQVVPTPPWMATMVPPLALVDPGQLSAEPLRLIVAASLRGTEADIEGELHALWALQCLPAAWQRETRLARLLLPAGDGAGLWIPIARLGAPGVAPWRPRDAHRELSWRAMLALVAVGIIRGRLGPAEGADLMVAETGMDQETAGLQVAHIAAQPTAALAFVAGVRLADRWAARLADLPAETAAAARANMLRSGPLPAACLEMVAGYTP